MSMPNSAPPSPIRQWRIRSSRAALVGTLIKGIGADHVLWGTDSVWYGSPQWQIEAMRAARNPRGHAEEAWLFAARRRQQHDQATDLRRQRDQLYRLKLKAADNTRMPAFSKDRLTELKREYELAAKKPTNLRYGYVRAG